jgi:hypothetical protein
MAVNRDVLRAGLCQLTAKYVGRGVSSITMQMVAGVPAYIMRGPTKAPPQGLPGSITVPDVSGKATAVRILWSPASGQGIDILSPGPGTITPMPKPNETDLDTLLWRGFTPIERRDVVREFTASPVPQVPTVGAIPAGEGRELQLSLDTTGAWGWWTKPFDAQSCLCCTFYATPVQLFRYVVPQDLALVIDGWSFFVYGNFFVGETFNVRFLRDGETILSYDEVIVDPTNPDPAKKCLFSGSVDQTAHGYLRIDRNQTLTVVATPKGLFPFNNGPADPFCGSICCLLHGHIEALRDNRDGAPRPKDVGRMRDDVNGDGLLNEVTEADVRQLLDWLDDASANAAQPTPEAPRDVADPVNTGAPEGSSKSPVDVESTSKGNTIVGGSVLIAAAIAATLGGQDGTPLE